jgi:hypothetical protein
VSDPNPLDCGHPPTPQPAGSCASGIARTVAGWTMCFRCAHDDQIVALLTQDVIFGYVSSTGPERSTFTTWPGGELGTVRSLRYSRERRARYGGTWRMRHITVRDVHGQLWQGQGSDQWEAITLRRVVTT